MSWVREEEETVVVSEKGCPRPRKQHRERTRGPGERERCGGKGRKGNVLAEGRTWGDREPAPDHREPGQYLGAVGSPGGF